MLIHYSDYVLEARTYSSSTRYMSRKGILLKVQFDDGSIGFADCHPWPELGDRAIEEQIAGLRGKTTTSLTRSSLRFAYLDAQARKLGKSLFEGYKVPLSHFLIPDILACEQDLINHVIAQGYTHVKVKLGKQLKQEIPELLHLFSRTPLKLRFDFNQKLSKGAFYSFLEDIEDIQPQVDFIEDPFPFHPEDWKKCQDIYSVDLACDRHVAAARYWPESCSYLIVKPAVHSIDLFSRCPRKKLIVTSYLDHPIGQISAAYTAAKLDPHNYRIHGLLSHHAYNSNVFSLQLSQQGPSFISPQGYGCGYEQQLASIHWRTL